MAKGLREACVCWQWHWSRERLSLILQEGEGTWSHTEAFETVKQALFLGVSGRWRGADGEGRTEWVAVTPHFASSVDLCVVFGLDLLERKKKRQSYKDLSASTLDFTAPSPDDSSQVLGFFCPGKIEWAVVWLFTPGLCCAQTAYYQQPHHCPWNGAILDIWCGSCVPLLMGTWWLPQPCNVWLPRPAFPCLEESPLATPGAPRPVYPARCMVESHLAWAGILTARLYTQQLCPGFTPALVLSWHCALTSDSHPDICSWSETHPLRLWLKALVISFSSEAFQNIGSALGKLYNLLSNTFISPNSNGRVCEARIVADLLGDWRVLQFSEFCRIGTVCSWELIFFSLCVHWGRTGRNGKEVRKMWHDREHG